MAKPELEFTPTEHLPWTQQVGGVPGMMERVLAADSESGDLTRLSWWKPGTDSSSLGVQAHNYWEEVLILDGEIEDVSLRQTFRKGFYACRPPGMKHGPWRTEGGVFQLELRRYQ